jgi:ATP/maltotriose-dependent transcriptional regulator MalT
VAELLAEAQRQDVGAQLLTLVRKELIRPDRATVPGDDGFRFGHILIRDAAYEAIPKRQRAALHERYADWLAARLGDETPDEILGYHLEQAYRYGAELGGADPALGGRAAASLLAAAQAARTRADVAATVNFLGRALELVPEGELRRRVLTELGEALSKAGDLVRAQEMLEEAAELAQAAGDAHVGWLARLQLAFLRIRLAPEGAGELALADGQAALAECEDGDHVVLAWAWNLISEVHLLRSEAVQQQSAIERAIDHAREAGDLALEVDLVTRSAPPIIFGAVPVDEGLRYADEILERLGDNPAVRAMALHIVGHLRARRGDFDGALAAMQEWRSRFRELGQETLYAATAGCVWDVCSWAEDWKGGERALREGYEMLEQMGDRGFLATEAVFLGEAVYHQGRLAEAERYSAIGEELGVTEDRMNEAAWRKLRARVLAARGDLDRARALAQEAAAIAAETDYIELEADARLVLAEILREAGEPDWPTEVGESAELYERKGNLVGVRRAKTLLEAAN